MSKKIVQLSKSDVIEGLSEFKDLGIRKKKLGTADDFKNFLKNNESKILDIFIEVADNMYDGFAKMRNFIFSEFQLDTYNDDDPAKMKQEALLRDLNGAVRAFLLEQNIILNVRGQGKKWDWNEDIIVSVK